MVSDGRCGVLGCDVPPGDDARWCARHAPKPKPNLDPGSRWWEPSAWLAYGCLESGRYGHMVSRVKHKRRLVWCRACFEAAWERERARRDRDRDRPMYARCKRGRGWLWAATANARQVRIGSPEWVTGYAATEAEAD